MASLNKVTLIGNLGADPEIRYTQNSTAVANISIATTERWKDKQTGQPKEETEWHRCIAYRRQAEIAGEYLKKGSKVYIEGRLKTRKWTGQDNVERYTTEIVINELKMLDSRQDAGARPQQANQNQQGYQQPQSQNVQQNSQQRQQNAAPPAFDPNATDFDDDIPFA